MELQEETPNIIMDAWNLGQDVSALNMNIKFLSISKDVRVIHQDFKACRSKKGEPKHVCSQFTKDQ